MQASLLNNCLQANPPFIYGLDVRAKMIVSITASILCICLSNIGSQALLLAASLIYALSMKRPILLVIVYAVAVIFSAFALLSLMLLMQILPMKEVSLTTVVVPIMRMLVMVHVVLPLAFTTPIQSFLSAFKTLHIPFVIYIPLVVMIRYIPSFIEDFKLIAEALKIRGYRLNPISFLKNPILSLRFLIIPLLFRALKTSDELGIAAELKGVSAGKKSSLYKPMLWKSSDTMFILIFIGIIAMVISSMWLIPADSFFATSTAGVH